MLQQKLTFMHCQLSLYTQSTSDSSVWRHACLSQNPQNLRRKQLHEDKPLLLSFTSGLFLCYLEPFSSAIFSSSLLIGLLLHKSPHLPLHKEKIFLVDSKFPCGLLATVPISTVETNLTTMVRGQEQREVWLTRSLIQSSPQPMALAVERIQMNSFELLITSFITELPHPKKRTCMDIRDGRHEPSRSLHCGLLCVVKPMHLR